MQTLLLPAAVRSGTSSALAATSYPVPPLSHRQNRRQLSPPNSLPFPRKPTQSLSSSAFFSPPPYDPLETQNSRLSFTPQSSSSPVSPTFIPPNDDAERAKLAQVAKRLENTSRYFKRFGSFGFWGQLICTIVSAVILSFSIVVTGKISSPFTFYATSGGIAAAFMSVFWSFGYIRLSERLRKTATDPSKAPPRADVVKSLKNGIVLNLLGMGAAILGLQATVGLLVAKALTSSTNPYYQGIAPGSAPVLALDVFLVQASANTILSHFLGLVSSLELLRSVTLPPPSESPPVPKLA
ncbi:Protein TIC 21, chloroplastic [Turnera subulata]|uniref:Protein TIC 21, chloroplastic n=1 Tax=Turnera subulata TaxID=218843 RepID=A0A9Q0J5V6_9ROSI|nr:Protein TIC 21, chloroplastic [Turnera subulata]